MAKFSYFPISIPEPEFGSKLVDYILEIYALKSKTNIDQIKGATPQVIFDQLREIFHSLESVYSARIEGNHTTIAKYLDSKTSSNRTNSEKILEIQNIEKCLAWLESIPTKDLNLNQNLLKNIHSQIVNGLSTEGEGDKTPGEYRNIDIQIGQSEHLPPILEFVPKLMSEFEEFVTTTHDTKYEPLKLAICHHRLAWIHPFGNGNGRTVRVWTYAMLLKYGYIKDRIINPTAVFCGDRVKYYEYLSKGDTGTKQRQLDWCEYVLAGLCKEFSKIDELNNYQKTKNLILLPALEYIYDKGSISNLELVILKNSLESKDGIFGAGDINSKVQAYTISRAIKKMLSEQILIKYSPRKYIINLNHPKIVISIAYQLEKNRFLSEGVDSIN